MSEQQSGPSRPQNSGGGNNNNNRRHHHNRNRRPQGPAQASDTQRPGPRPGQQDTQQVRPPGQGPKPGGSGQRRRHRSAQGRNRPPGQGPGQGQAQGHQTQQHYPNGINLERLYEKYLNLLDQHLIARRKYHDMFYRAEPSQKAKLERNFYNTLNDVREFENKMTPESRELFEKRNNGLAPDTIYTTNHQIVETEEKRVVPEEEIEDPHFLQSQRAADYSGDTEESAGSLDDYLRYKNLV
jgi:hypothetical protein